MEDNLKITKRHLPHWYAKDATYFITFRAYTVFNVTERKYILDHIKSGNEKYYTLLACVIMPDHSHLLLSPIKEYSLERIMKGIKGVSARMINSMRGSHGQIWQHESYDHIIRNGKELRQKFDYIAFNPVKAELIEETQEYLGWYCNEKISV